MRIAQIATLARPVPPAGEGSIEYLVGQLVEELVRRGHEVTLYATADSRTSAALRSPVQTSYVTDAEKWDWQLYELFQAREAFGAWRDFDVIHCHAYWFGLMFCDLFPIPSLHSIHIEPGPDYRFVAARTRNRRFHCASQWQAGLLGEREDLDVVAHGIDVDALDPAGEPVEDYLAFLGRFIPGKGVLEAIEVARRAGLPLRLAAPHNEYYEQAIRPHVDGRNVEYVGEVRGEEKRRFLARARGLVYPAMRGEPFGLVLVEAMAAGLPVLALARGAVPEIIEHGRSGWLGERVEDLVAGAGRLAEFDRGAIRAHAREHYHYTVMADRIEGLLRRMVEERES